MTVDLYQPLCGHTTHNLQPLGDNRSSLHGRGFLLRRTTATLTLK